MPTKQRADSSRRIIILGSTGSIGRNVLHVIDHLAQHDHARFDIVGLAAGRSAEQLAEQASRTGCRAVALDDAAQAEHLTGVEQVFTGQDAARQLIDAVAREGDCVVAAMVGFAGLAPVLDAIDRGCNIALANKETLVAAGELVMRRVRDRGVELLPIDSEHSAIHQCLRSGHSTREVNRLVLTASGGPFRTFPREAMENVSVEQALNHPTWNMGRKITIDSATLMNKALEIIEAHWLFGLPASQIDAIIHPQSIIHSFVEFIDHSIIAQLGPPDMQTPIQYALTWPERVHGGSTSMNWCDLRQMDFEPVDEVRFPAIGLAHRVLEEGGAAGAVFNAANEQAVHAFLDRRIGYTAIAKVVEQALDRLSYPIPQSLEDAREADQAARRLVDEHVRQRAGQARVSSSS
jgi:1-deoxy-D-xylulose-5-phosphate reductoisomerase